MTLHFFNEPSMADKIGFLITMLIVLIILIGFEVKSWLENRRTNRKAKSSIKPIPLWKWILLYFCPTHIGFDSEGEVASVCFAKVLFKDVYIMRIDYFDNKTGNLIKTERLTRKG